MLIQAIAEELHTVFPLQMFIHPIHSFLKVSFGNNVFNSHLDLKCFKCRGCEHCPGI